MCEQLNNNAKSQKHGVYVLKPAFYISLSLGQTTDTEVRYFCHWLVGLVGQKQIIAASNIRILFKGR